VPLVEQELLTLSQHLSSPSFFSCFRVSQYLIFCVVFCWPLFVFLFCFFWGTWVAQWVRSLDLIAHASLSPIRCVFVPSFVNYKKGCTRLTAASDKIYQLLAQGRWFSPGTPASSTTKTGRHEWYCWKWH